MTDQGDYDTARRRLRGRRPTRSAVAEAAALVHAVVTEAAASSASPQSSESPQSITAAPSADDLLAALIVLRHLRQQLSSWEPQLIAAARAQGVSWASLAPALGVTSRQAAERRYLRLRPSETGEPTGEGRVQAERTKRAGDRAVAAWARENSRVLRQLAGQVSALEGLSGTARHQVDVVYHALADNDPANLLSPLADAHSHIRETHTELAEQIKSVTEHTERLRRHTRNRRAAG